MKQLYANSKLLTTHFDLYATLVEIANVSARSLSLFARIWLGFSMGTNGIRQQILQTQPINIQIERSSAQVSLIR